MSAGPRVCGLMVVRNEADILPVNLRHHFAAGIEHVFAVDNGSSDGTPDVLQQFAKEGRVTWRRDAGAYRQSALTTELARDAFRHGAQWVIPIDADEFWHAPGGSLPEILGESRAGALRVEVINFIQRRDQQQPRPEALLLATRRPALPIGPLEAVRDLVEKREYGFVEVKYQPKYVSRALAAIEIGIGNHSTRAGGDRGPEEATDRIVCLHLPLRSRETLTGKVEHGERLAALGLDASQGWHVLRWRRLHAENELDREWRANSYEDGELDVFGRPHPLVFDPSLRDLVRPWIDGEAAASDRGEADELKRTIHLQLHAGLRVESSAREEFAAVRARVGELQQELFEKVDEANGVIRVLQEELAAARARVGELQQELFQKVGEANAVIRDLQIEMQTKIKDANAIIDELQARLAAESPPVSTD